MSWGMLGQNNSNNGFDWSSLIQPAVQAGGSILGSSLANKQNNAVAREQLAQNQRQFDTNQQFKLGEQARRNQISGVAAPALLHALGYRDPAQISALQQQFSQQPTPSLGSAGNGGISYQPTASGPGGASKALGAAGGGLGMGLASGLITASGPAAPLVAPALLGGSLIASQIGKGRRAADSFVKGVEEPFGKQDLAKVVQMKNSGDVAGATQLFNNAYSAYKQAVQAALAKGGNEAKVAQQSLENGQLQGTIHTIAQQLGVQI